MQSNNPNLFTQHAPHPQSAIQPTIPSIQPQPIQPHPTLANPAAPEPPSIMPPLDGEAPSVACVRMLDRIEAKAASHLDNLEKWARRNAFTRIPSSTRESRKTNNCKSMTRTRFWRKVFTDKLSELVMAKVYECKNLEKLVKVEQDREKLMDDRIQSLLIQLIEKKESRQRQLQNPMQVPMQQPPMPIVQPQQHFPQLPYNIFEGFPAPLPAAEEPPTPEEAGLLPPPPAQQPPHLALANQGQQYAGNAAQVGIHMQQMLSAQLNGINAQPASPVIQQHPEQHFAQLDFNSLTASAIQAANVAAQAFQTPAVLAGNMYNTQDQDIVPDLVQQYIATSAIPEPMQAEMNNIIRNAMSDMDLANTIPPEPVGQSPVSILPAPMVEADEVHPALGQPHMIAPMLDNGDMAPLDVMDLGMAVDWDHFDPSEMMLLHDAGANADGQGDPTHLL